MSPSDPGVPGIWADLLESNSVRGGRAVLLGIGTGEIRALLEARGVSVQAVDAIDPVSPPPVAGASQDLVVVPDLPSGSPAMDRWLNGLLAPGGALIVSMANSENAFRPRRDARCETLKGASVRFAALGFRIVQVRYHGDGTLLSRIAALFLPSRRTKTRFASVFRRSS